MAREALVVFLLRIPYEFVVAFSKETGRILRSFVIFLIRSLLYPLICYRQRSHIGVLFLYSSFRLALISFYVFCLSKLWYCLFDVLSNSDQPIFLSLIILGNIIIGIGGLKKVYQFYPESEKTLIVQAIDHSLIDFYHLVLTILLATSIFGVFKLIRIETQPLLYDDWVKKALCQSWLNVLESLFLIPLFIFPWRLIGYFQKREQFKSIKGKVSAIFCGIGNGIVDIPFVPFFVVLFLSILYTVKLIKFYKQGRISRLIIIILFLRLFVYYFSIFLGILNALCIVRSLAVMKTTLNLFQRKINDTKALKELIYHSIHTLLFPVVALEMLIIAISIYKIKNMRIEIYEFLLTANGYYKTMKQTNQAVLELCIDLLYLIIIIGCSVFIWRSIPFFRSIDRNNWHESVNIMLKEVIQDILCLPFLALKMLCPWRVLTDIPSIYKAPSPDEQRRIIKENSIIGLADYITVVCCVILILTVWRSFNTLRIIKIHFKNYAQADLLALKIFKETYELALDLGCLLLGLLNIIMLIEVTSYYKRLRQYYYNYKERNGFELIEFIENKFRQKHRTKENRLETITIHVFANICSFLDCTSVAVLERTNKNIRSKIQNSVIWKELYKNQWEKFYENQPHESYSYKELVKHKFCKLTQNPFILKLCQIDRKQGLRYIIIDTFFCSMFRLDHLAFIPAKIIAFIHSKFHYFDNISRDFLVYVRSNNILTYSSRRAFNPRHADTIYSIHLSLPIFCDMLSLFIVEKISYISCKVHFAMLRLLSYGNWSDFTQSNIVQTRIPYVCYVLQLLYTVLAYAIIFVFIFVADVLLCNVYLDKGLLAAIAFYLLRYTLSNRLGTMLFSTHEAYLGHFNFHPETPIKSLRKIILNVSKVVFNWNNWLRIINFFWFYFKCVFGFRRGIFRQIINKICSFLKDVAIAFSPDGYFMQLYKDILFNSGRYLFRFGRKGDLIYSPIVITWVLWPIFVPYLLGNNLLLGVSIPLCVFLLLQGYPLAITAWSKA